MAKLTRRGFFRQTSASVVTLGVIAAAPRLAADPEVSEATATELSTTATELSGSVIAHVRDVATGEISLLVGTQEIIFRDPQVVLRLMQAVR
jgi:hypothetical protein